MTLPTRYAEGEDLDVHIQRDGVSASSYCDRSRITIRSKSSFLFQICMDGMNEDDEWWGNYASATLERSELIKLREIIDAALEGVQ